MAGGRTMKRDFLELNKIPYICIPLTGESKKVIKEQLHTILPYQPDIIEWRVDFFKHIKNINEVHEVIQTIKLITDIPLLFTIRAEHEGGEKIPLHQHEKLDLFKEVCQKSKVDIIDFEISNGVNEVEKVCNSAKSNHKKLILSYHNFTYTPPNKELIQLAIEAERAGADVAKLAVMPEHKADVLRLLHVTNEMDELLSIPVTTMSMGDIGGLSRVIGWVYGSAMTFGVGAKSSAPGQLPVNKLRKAIEQTQQLVDTWK